MAERLTGRPDFELAMYDGYGHAAYDTAPDYTERVRNFLLSEPAEDPGAELRTERKAVT